MSRIDPETCGASFFWLLMEYVFQWLQNLVEAQVLEDLELICSLLHVSVLTYELQLLIYKYISLKNFKCKKLILERSDKIVTICVYIYIRK